MRESVYKLASPMDRVAPRSVRCGTQTKDEGADARHGGFARELVAGVYTEAPRRARLLETQY